MSHFPELSVLSKASPEAVRASQGSAIAVLGLRRYTEGISSDVDRGDRVLRKRLGMAPLTRDAGL
jgi:hypothetical protein